MAAAATGPGAATETAAPVRAPSSDETSSGVASNSPSNSHMLWRRRAARKPSLLLVSGHISRADREASPCITSIIVRAPHTVGVEVQGEINLSTHTQTGNRAPSGFDKALCPRDIGHTARARAPAATRHSPDIPARVCVWGGVAVAQSYFLWTVRSAGAGCAEVSGRWELHSFLGDGFDEFHSCPLEYLTG